MGAGPIAPSKPNAGGQVILEDGKGGPGKKIIVLGGANSGMQGLEFGSESEYFNKNKALFERIS